MTTETFTIASAEDLALSFVTTGFIPKEQADILSRAEKERRTEIASFLISVTEDLTIESEKTRSAWLARQLSKEAIEPQPFCDYVSRPVVTSHREGLGDRVFTDGKHSSPYTSGTNGNDAYYNDGQKKVA